MAKNQEPVDLVRERGIREGARLLANAGIADAAEAENVSRWLQELVEEFFASRRPRRRRATIGEQWDAGLAAGEREGPL
jgi:hypothetical protein